MKRPKLKRGVVIEVAPYGCAWIAVEFTASVRPGFTARRLPGFAVATLSLGFVLVVVGFTRD